MSLTNRPITDGRGRPVGANTQRLFLAVHLSTEIIAALGRVRQLASAIDPDMKWVRPEHLHCTVRFLGDCTAEQSESIQRIAARVASLTSPFRLHLGHLGVFPNLRQPRVLWADILEGADVLTAVHESLEKELLAAGIVGEQERFRPHITLSRVRERLSPQHLSAIGQFVAKAPPLDFGSQSVSALALVHSTLSTSGPTYRDLAIWPLADPNPGLA